MRIYVERILNKPIDSNSFVVYTSENKRCIIIDPGTEDSADLITFIQINNLQPEFIFLTHEHFDHIWGVNLLKDLYNAQIVCSLSCAEKIVNRKKNMSVFYNQVGFETFPADIIVNDECKIKWHNKILQIIETPGHTDGSICISINDNLFTGDTIIKDHKTVIKLPGGSKDKLKFSLSKIFLTFSNQRMNVYPGHGETFLLEECFPPNFY